VTEEKIEQKKPPSRNLLDKLLAKHYYDAGKAKEEGKPVGWATSIFPQELIETLGLHVVYPENHAAAISARRKAQDYIDVAENQGYSTDLCSYARLNMGYLNSLQSDVLNLPAPDFICCCNNICNEVIKWYENIARERNIPLIMVDAAYNVRDVIEQDRVNYIKGQFNEAIRQLEEVAGKKFDYERFAEVMAISVRNGELWKHAMSLTSYKPSPFSGFEMFNFMALIVCNRGLKEIGPVFELLAQELTKLGEAGETTFPGVEKFRIMYDGIPCWPTLGATMKTLLRHGINVVASGYPDAWVLLYDVNDLDGMARAYSSVFNNMNLQSQIDLRVRLVKATRCDGVIWHMNRSCKIWDMMMYEIAKGVEKASGVPYVIFDGDQSDARAFSQAQFDTRVQGLVEIMAAKN
jgi:benzoyl-CoA reductase/2-hydroxyglutaryl-CoA dehydratase subunit BcrC/BadD/HgdB